MGNRGSQSDKQDRAAAGQVGKDSAKASEAKGSPSRFRFRRDLGKKQTKSAASSATSSPAEVRRISNACHVVEKPPDIVKGHLRNKSVASTTSQGVSLSSIEVSIETSPSPESSVSSSLYVDTVSRLPSPDETTLCENDSTIEGPADEAARDELSPESVVDNKTLCGDLAEKSEMMTQKEDQRSSISSVPSTPSTQSGMSVTMGSYTLGRDSRLHSTGDVELRSHGNKYYSRADSSTSLHSSTTSLERNDDVRHLPSDYLSGSSRASLDHSSTGSITSGASPFTVTQHKKIVLPPHKFSTPPINTPSTKKGISGSEEVLRPASLFTSTEPRVPKVRRHSSHGDVLPMDGNVLRKVASLTLEKATIDARVSKPKFVPEKLDFSLYEKFEGQMLINWFCGAFPDDHYFRLLLTRQDLKTMAIQFCTHLLAAGVLRQIEDGGTSRENVFRPDLMYYWTHSESHTSTTPLPGKLSPSIWPPPSLESGDQKPGAQYTEADLQHVMNGLKKQHSDTLDRLQKEQELALFHLRGEQAARLNDYENKVQRLEREVEKYQTLAGIAELTRKANSDLEMSPLGRSASFAIENASTQTEHEAEKNSSAQTDSFGVDIESQTDTELHSKPDVVSVSVQSEEKEVSPAEQAVSSTSVGVDCQPSVAHICVQTVPEDVGLMPSKSETKAGVPPKPPSDLGGTIPPAPPLPSQDLGSTPSPAPVSGKVPPPPPPPHPPMPPASGIPPPPPPPPPLPGTGGIPPPPPMPGMPPPPPPPMPGMPPPPPPMPGMPPPPPPPPGTLLTPSAAGSPAPFPPPPPGGWHGAYSAARKQPLSPKVPMKPLYWNRIQVPPDPSAAPEEQRNSLWMNLEEDAPDDWEEFASLFSRQVVDKKPVQAKSAKKKNKQVAKLLDQKRSQNVGILISSLHLEISEVENAVYNFDTNVVDTEALQSIYEVRPTKEEIQVIQHHLETQPDVPLDKPEQFLYDLSRIPNYADRVACMMFQSNFTETIAFIEHKLNNLKMTCDFLMTSQELQHVFGIILALGNYMNGGNRSRGQADGFGLEILPKLRDVKSKDSSLTLLHFVVRTYVTKYLKDVCVEKCKLPVPEPSDVERAATVNFDGVADDLRKLHAQIISCEKKLKNVLESSDGEHQSRFNDKMVEVLKSASREHKEQEENLEECKAKFASAKKFFSWHSKANNPAEEPKEFFSPWTPFCGDFKDIWKKELQRKLKQDVAKAQKKLKETAEERKSKIVKQAGTTPSGLKAKLGKKARQLPRSETMK